MLRRKEALARRLRLLANLMADTAVKLADFDVTEEWLDFAKGMAQAAADTREVAEEVAESPDHTLH